MNCLTSLICFCSASINERQWQIAPEVMVIKSERQIFLCIICKKTWDVQEQFHQALQIGKLSFVPKMLFQKLKYGSS